MAITTQADKKRHGIELIEHVYFGIRSIARFAIRNYQAKKATDLPSAINDLKVAISQANLVRAQIDTWIADYDAVNGAGSAVIVLAECVTESGMDIPLSQINSELTSLENASLILFDNQQNNGWSWDQVAAAMEEFLGPKPDGTKFPLPAGWTNLWGE